MCVFVGVCAHEYSTCEGLRYQISWSWRNRCLETPYEGWEPNSGLLQFQYTLLNVEAYSQALNGFVKNGSGFRGHLTSGSCFPGQRTAPGTH